MFFTVGRKIKLSIVALATFCVSVPFFVSAHVKWFAESVAEVKPYSFSDIEVWVGVCAAAAAVVFGAWLHKKARVPARVSRFVEAAAPAALSLASIGFGLAFIIFTIQGFVFAPNLVAHGTFGTLMLVIQGVAGIMMLLGLYERIGGLLLIVLFALGTKAFGSVEMVDTLEMLGFALYAMIVGRPKWKIADSEIMERLTHRIHAYGQPILRVGTGLNLIVLGFSEKIFAPELTQDFLSRYDWNFMHTLGLTAFTDYWFAFAAGIGEILFGIFFVLGFITRITTVCLAIFLCTTLILLGPVELVGHLPHFSIAIALLVLGSGSRLTFFR